MARENSFDVVSAVDMQEVDNAFQQTKREISTRYDLKDSGAEISLNKKDKTITITAPADFVSKQIRDVLESKLIKRGIEISALRWGMCEQASGQGVRVGAQIIDGIDTETCKKISKDIKAEKFKAKVTIEDEKLRISSAKRDILQEIIAFLKEKDYGLPLQYTNYR